MTKRALAACLTLLVCADAYLAHSLFWPVRPASEPLAAGKGGEARLVQFPNGRTVLLGTGTDASIVRALGDALPPWQRHVDAVLLPNESAGAIGGAPFVLARYRVGVIIVERAGGTPTREAALAAAASATRVPIREIPPGAGLSIQYGETALSLDSSTAK